VRRRDRIVLLCVAAFVVAALRPSPSGHERPRNVLLITLDTMRADRLPAYGFTGVLTPTLDRIAAEGVVFEDAFAAVPLTLPSHATLMTGIYPPRLGVRDNAGVPLSDEFTTLAEMLREQRLNTAAFVASSVLAPRRGLGQGFDVYSAGAFGRCGQGPPARRRADAVVDEALGWFQRNGTDPFFVWLHLYDTHRPYDLPAEYTERYFDPYLAAIAYEDAELGRVVSELERRGLLESTLIVVTGDHGESLGGHGEQSHGIFLYQEALRVPLVMRGPGLSPKRTLGVVRLVDVMPTVLSLFGLSITGIDGVNLSPNQRSRVASPREVYAESMYPERFGWGALRSLQADRYKFIDAPRPELYDLARDPSEQRSVIAEHPSVARAMLRRLAAYDVRQTPAGVPAAKIDGRILEQITSLGYVGSIAAAATVARGEQPDPKDRIDAFNRHTSLQWDSAERRRQSCR
jgi:choline-sulfatase